MYTYDSFETAGAFTLLRPIFVTFIFALLLMFLIILLPKLRRKMVNSLSVVVGLSLVSIIASAQLLFYDAIIVDEIGLEGDEITTYMFLVILFFGFLNPIIFFTKRSKKEVSKVNPSQ